MGWVVYLLRCADESLYCGVTNDLQRRLRQHRGEITGGAKYTQSRRPCVLVYQENSDGRSQALQREAEIKKMKKSQKMVLINKVL